MPLIASRAEQFEAPQLETVALELEIFSLAQVHAIAEQQARAMVGAAQRVCAGASGWLHAVASNVLCVTRACDERSS